MFDTKAINEAYRKDQVYSEFILEIYEKIKSGIPAEDAIRLSDNVIGREVFEKKLKDEINSKSKNTEN